MELVGCLMRQILFVHAELERLDAMRVLSEQDGRDTVRLSDQMLKILTLAVAQLLLKLLILSASLFGGR